MMSLPLSNILVLINAIRAPFVAEVRPLGPPNRMDPSRQGAPNLHGIRSERDVFLFRGTQATNCGAVDNFPGGIETRSVAGTIPRAFCGVPIDDTTQVGAHGRVL